MIYTSYFARLSKMPKNLIPISICGGVPTWYKGLQYKKVAPKYDFFVEWKKNQDNDFYIKNFNEKVLANLTQDQVVEDLQKLLPEDIQEYLDNAHENVGISNQYHVALVCYERPGAFCHRHLVADWLEEADYRVKEFQYDL